MNYLKILFTIILKKMFKLSLKFIILIKNFKQYFIYFIKTYSYEFIYINKKTYLFIMLFNYKFYWIEKIKLFVFY